MTRKEWVEIIDHARKDEDAAVAYVHKEYALPSGAKVRTRLDQEHSHMKAGFTGCRIDFVTLPTEGGPVFSLNVLSADDLDALARFRRALTMWESDESDRFPTQADVDGAGTVR